MARVGCCPHRVPAGNRSGTVSDPLNAAPAGGGVKPAVDTVLFDFDGTIADTVPLVVSAFQQTFAEFDGRHLSWDEVIALFGPPEGAIFRRHLRAAHRWEAALARFNELYRELHGEQVVRSPELEATLWDLKARGVRLGLVTGKARASAAISLDALHLDGVFDVVVAGDDVARPKPDPEGIHIALRRLEARADRALYVGDMDGDVLAGRAAGVTTVGAAWFRGTRRGFLHPPDRLFHRVADFRHYLDEVLA